MTIGVLGWSKLTWALYQSRPHFLARLAAASTRFLHEFGLLATGGLHNLSFAVSGAWQIDQSDEQNDERPQ
jgi:hypothetical protein